MKRDPDAPSIAEMLEEMMGNNASMDRLDHSLTPDEQLALKAEYQAIAQNTDQIRTLCIACGADSPLLLSAMCECGGFVCEACQRIEEDGTCDHLPPEFPGFNEELDDEQED